MSTTETSEANQLLAEVGVQLVRVVDDVDPALWDKLPEKVRKAIDAYHAATAAQDAQFAHNESLTFGGYAGVMIADPITDAAERLLDLHEGEPIQ